MKTHLALGGVVPGRVVWLPPNGVKHDEAVFLSIHVLVFPVVVITASAVIGIAVPTPTLLGVCKK